MLLQQRQHLRGSENNIFAQPDQNQRPKSGAFQEQHGQDSRGKKIVLLNAQKDLVTHLGGLCWIDTCEKAEFDAKAPQVKWRAGSLFKKRLYQTTFSSIIFQSMSNLCMFFAQHLRARVHKLQGQQQHVFLRLHPELQFH